MFVLLFGLFPKEEKQKKKAINYGCFLKKKNRFACSYFPVIETLVKHLPIESSSHSISYSPKHFHLCFYNLKVHGKCGLFFN